MSSPNVLFSSSVTIFTINVGNMGYSRDLWAMFGVYGVLHYMLCGNCGFDSEYSKQSVRGRGLAGAGLWTCTVRLQAFLWTIWNSCRGQFYLLVHSCLTLVWIVLHPTTHVNQWQNQHIWKEGLGIVFDTRADTIPKFQSQYLMNTLPYFEKYKDVFFKTHGI